MLRSCAIRFYYFCRSTIKPNTLTPVWDEYWNVRNVPSTATLHVRVLDKDDGQITDDYIGKFVTDITDGAKELNIEGPALRRSSGRGTFWLKVMRAPAFLIQPALR